MPEFRPKDLCVVIPTRDRWSILQRTLRALGHQTVGGFEVVVVVDGTDQEVPDLPGARVVVKEHAGPGAARNLGVASTDRRLILLLGDDTIPEPDMIEHHIKHHIAEPDERVAVLGRIDWHPSCAANRVNRWMEWSGTQFEYHNIEGEDAGWGRFYSSNVSIKRSLFDAVGGFDEDFPFAAYEDIELGMRLNDLGLVLRYEPAARALHDHQYTVAALKRRFATVAAGEWMMIKKHPEFPAFFTPRIKEAASLPHASPVWQLIVDRIPERAHRLRLRARLRANVWYLQQVADAYLGLWDGQSDLEELKEYLGDSFDDSLLRGHAAAVDQEFDDAPSEDEFYRTSSMYLYDLTVFAMTGTKRPYHALLREIVPLGSRLLDWGCGIGSDGLRFIEDGYDVAFADYDSPSTKYLRWRLEKRGSDAPVYDLDGDVPQGFDAAYAFDVIEHVADPFAFLAEMEKRAALVVVNLLEPDPNDTHLHKPLPIKQILDHAEKRGLVRYRVFHGRSHVIAYRTGAPTTGARVRSALERRVAPHLHYTPA